MRSPILNELPPSPEGKTGWPWTEEVLQLPPSMPDGSAWPRISVVTPSYNQGLYLEETIRSVLLQGYPDLEYVVIDGGSKDASLEIIRKYSPWLTYWESQPDRGQSHAINKGWARVSGDLIAYLNSDDFYFPFAFQQVAQLWRKDSNVAMITGGVAFTDENAKNIRVHPPFLMAESPLDLSLLEPSKWFLPQQATFFPRAYLDRVQRCMREDLHFTMDRELMYRICRQGKVLLLEATLAGDRHHSLSKRLSQTLMMYHEDAIAMAYCDWGGSKEAIRRKRIARWRLAQGHYQYANRAPSILSSLHHFGLAAFYRPSYLTRRSFLKSLIHTVGIQLG